MSLGQLFAAISLALNTIREHKMRAFLTVLGVIIGTGTIIGVGSILTGLDGAITGVLRSFGTNSMLVFKFPAGMRFGNLSAEERMRKPITYDIAQAIADRCQSVQNVSAFLMPWNMESRSPQIFKIRYKSNDMFQIDLGGTTPNFAQATQIELQSGRFFND